MTIEELIKCLILLKAQARNSGANTFVWDISIDSFNYVIDTAIKALDQEHCEDAISRQAVLDGMASIAKAKAKSDAQKSLMGRIMFFTEHLPSVNPQEPTTKND